MVEAIYPTIDNSVRRTALEEESRLKIFLMLGDCVGEKLTLEVVLRYEVSAPSTAAKYCCSVFLRKTVSLGRFYNFLAVDVD